MREDDKDPNPKRSDTSKQREREESMQQLSHYIIPNLCCFRPMFAFNST